MLLWLLEPLVPIFRGFNLVRYVTFRAAFAAVLAFLIVIVCGPGVIAWLRGKKLHGCANHDSARLEELRAAKQDIPTMGGILILGGVLVSVLLLGRLDNVYVVLVLFAFLAFGLLGALDDWAKLTVPGRKGMSAKRKLFGQLGIAAAALVVLYAQASGQPGRPALRGPALRASPYLQTAEVAKAGDLPAPLPSRPGTAPIGPTEVAAPSQDHRTDLQVPFFKHFCLDLGLLFLVFGALVIVGASNAVNLTDGLDGLATGCTAIAALTFALVAYLVGRADTSEYLYVFHVPGAAELTVVCAALGGAALGFLWFNGFPASVFMGDTGSLALGGTLGLVAVAARQELTLLVAGGVFVAEAGSVIVQRRYYRWSGGKRLFRCAPLHHHFQFQPIHEAKVTIRFWIAALILALVSLALFKLR